MTKIGKQRSCGEGMTRCTLCCFTHARIQAWKPSPTYEWCTDCVIGWGCRLFYHAENGCCGWNCGWKEGIGTDDERPDKVDVVLSWTQTLVGKTLFISGATPTALDSEYSKRITREHVAQGIPVQREDVCGRSELVPADGMVIYPSVRQRIEEGGIEIVFMDVDGAA